MANGQTGMHHHSLRMSSVAQVHSGCVLLEGVVPLSWAPQVLKCCQGCFSEACGSGTQLLYPPGRACVCALHVLWCDPQAE